MRRSLPLPSLFTRDPCLLTKKNCVSRRSQPGQFSSVEFRSIPQKKHCGAGLLASGRFRALLSKSGGMKETKSSQGNMRMVLQMCFAPQSMS